MQIREATTKDADIISQLAKTTFDETFGYNWGYYKPYFHRRIFPNLHG